MGDTRGHLPTLQGDTYVTSSFTSKPLSRRPPVHNLGWLLLPAFPDGGQERSCWGPRQKWGHSSCFSEHTLCTWSVSRGLHY